MSTVVVSARGLSDEQRLHCKSSIRKVEKTACVVSIIICIVSMPVIKMGIILLRIVFGIVTIINKGSRTVKTRSSDGSKRLLMAKTASDGAWEQGDGIRNRKTLCYNPEGEPESHCV